MADIIWNKFIESQKNEYIKYLKIFGALSGLFKDNVTGDNAKKPYLYYRNHEQLFARVFSVEDLTRKDSAFDALMVTGNERIGIGLKTWIHSKDLTYQKVAEFNKLSSDVIEPIMQNGSPEDVIRTIANLRNERILLDKRLHKTDYEVYHYITRDDNVMNIIETSYDLIDLNTLELIEVTKKKTYTFKDCKHNYKYYKSKSVLLEEFDASKREIVEQIRIEQYSDPFELIKMININEVKPMYIKENSTNYRCLSTIQEKNIFPVIYLPLYQDKKNGMYVSSCSGVNIRHAKSKSKGSNIPRPEYEIEVRISKWIHHVFPGFFGINALDENEVKNAEKNDFDLILPNGRILKGRVKQQNGKSLQTNPQGALGEWILKDVLGLNNREVVTADLLQSLAIDSLKVTKIDDKHFKITVAENGAYEKFKLENREKMLLNGLKGTQLPPFRNEYMQEIIE